MSLTNHPPNRQWLPVKLGPADTSIISAVVAGVALVRALDYVTGADAHRVATTRSDNGAPALVGIEGAFPLWIWAILLSVGALTLLGGMATRRHFPVWLGHTILAIVYAGLCAGLLVGYLGVPSLDGVRGAVTLLFPAVFCPLVAMRMGARPLTIWNLKA